MDIEIGSIVRVTRRVGDRLGGVVAGEGERWLLLHRLVDLQLDGLCAVRRRDITKVRAATSGDHVAERSLRQRGVFPTPVTSVGLDRTGDVLEGLGALGIVTIHAERYRDHVCFLGVVGAVDRERKRFELLELSPSATWDTGPTPWRFRGVSRVEAVGGYDAAPRRAGGATAVTRRGLTWLSPRRAWRRSRSSGC